MKDQVLRKKRVSIPKRIADAVLREYRHKCAICGCSNPQLHHLDEDPSNSDPNNLLPLCPNCHLQDAHDPTSPPDPAKLRLFRLYKDPLILDPRFHPIFRRMAFLREKGLRLGLFRHRADEFLDFMSGLEMGGFYRKRILDCLKNPLTHYCLKCEAEGKAVTIEQLRLDQTLSAAAFDYRIVQVERLVVELLRYQGWGKSLPDERR